MNRIHYSELKTIDQLRNERLRLEDRVEITKEYIEGDIENIAGMFTFEGIVGMIFPRAVDGSNTFLNVAYSAYDLVSSIIGLVSGRRKKRR